MDLGVAGRTYLITGASAGLGFATAQQLVADGAQVVICSRVKERIESAAEALGTDQAIGVVADLGDEAAPQLLIDTALDHFGRIDGAVLSVGGPVAGSVTAVTDEQWRSAFDSVFLGPVRMARTLCQLERPATAGELAVTFVLSTSVRSPILPLGISNGLRPGLGGVVKALADEHAGRGIRVNAVLPGRIETDRIKEIEEASGDAEQARAEALRAIPMGRIGQPAEFGKVAAFLTSPAASYITGTALAIDGGATRSI